MKRSRRMGDVRHKQPPPSSEEEEVVTDAFRKAVRKALEDNAVANALGNRSKGDPGYLISNQAELAVAVKTSKRLISRIIGAARPTTKIELVDRSAFVGRIRAVLSLPAVTSISVPMSRADVLRFLAELPDAAFLTFEAEVLKLMKKRT